MVPATLSGSGIGGRGKRHADRRPLIPTIWVAARRRTAASLTYSLSGPVARTGSVSTVPPAAAIFSAALPLNLCARTVSGRSRSPRASTLSRRSAPATRPRACSSFGRDDGPRFEARRQRVEVHDLVIGPERVEEPALRHPAVQRHLAAFEAPLVLEAGARLRALRASAGRLAESRALTASHPLAGLLGALRRSEVAQIHVVSRALVPGALRSCPVLPSHPAPAPRTSTQSYSTVTRCLTFWIIPRTSGVSGTSIV